MSATLSLPPLQAERLELPEAPTPFEVVDLARLAPGQHAEVVEVDADCPVGRRLLDLGFRPGTPLRVVRRAPLGDPTTYELRGSRFCLRRSEALRIRVTQLPGA